MERNPERYLKGNRPLPLVRQERYCISRMNGLKPEEAFFQAGYKSRSAGAAGRLERLPTVQRRLEWLRSQVADRAIVANGVTRSEIIESLRDTRRLAKKGQRVLTRDGSDSGEVKLDLSTANRSDEILAKMHGFMLDVTLKENLDEELEGKDPVELKAFVLSLLEQLDPNMRKQLMAEVEVSDDDVVIQ